MSSLFSSATARIVLLYVAFAALWILLSDHALEALVRDASDFARLSIYKGWAFVLVTAVLLALLLRGELAKRRQAYDELERRVVERTAQLAEARDAAEAADRLKSAFLATMSHELRTPLNSIIGFTGIVLQELPGPLNDEQKKQLGMAQSSARHLLDLINDVLDLSKIEAGEMTIEAEPFDLAASVERIAAIVRPQAEHKGLGLRVANAPAFGLLIGDRRRVDQILFNLLSNAIKFTETGTVGISVERLAGAPASMSPGPALRIAVSDTGIGIAADDMAALFQPFRQVDSALSRKFEGTGLGLAICRRLAGLMGGVIEAESSPGNGSTFSLVLPLRSTPPAATASATSGSG